MIREKIILELLKNNNFRLSDRFYLKSYKNENDIDVFEVHDNYDKYYSCGLIVEGDNISVRSYSEMKDAPITLEQALKMTKDFFGRGADYGNNLVLDYFENKESLGV